MTSSKSKGHSRELSCNVLTPPPPVAVQLGQCRSCKHPLLQGALGHASSLCSYWCHPTVRWSPPHDQRLQSYSKPWEFNSSILQPLCCPVSHEVLGGMTRILFLFVAPHPSMTPATQEGLLDLKSYLLGIWELRWRDS